MMELEVLEMGVRRLRPTILRSSVLSRCTVGTVNVTQLHSRNRERSERVSAQQKPEEG